MPRIASSDQFIEFVIDVVRDPANSDPANSGRHMVAIAGPPASGKSTLAERTVKALNTAVHGSAAILAMDGFHLDNSVLAERGTLDRKGAPHTFDVAGFENLLKRLRAHDEPEVIGPVFDRSLDAARSGAVVIARSARVVVVEGNYLLLDEHPWSALAVLFDTTAYLDVSEPELERRLLERWSDQGLDTDVGRRMVEQNDLPNARRVASTRLPADWIITT